MNPPDKTLDSEQLGTINNAVVALNRVCSRVCLDYDVSGDDFYCCIRCDVYKTLHVLRRLLE